MIVSFIISVLVAFLYRKLVARNRTRREIEQRKLITAEFEAFFSNFPTPSLYQVFMRKLLILEEAEKLNQEAKEDLEVAYRMYQHAWNQLDRFIRLARLEGFGHEVDRIIAELRNKPRAR